MSIAPIELTARDVQLRGSLLAHAAPRLADCLGCRLELAAPAQPLKGP